MSNRTYDPNKDYKKMMDDAVANGDYASAAQYEQQRNAKIQGEGLTQYQTTNQYAQYLPKSTTPYDPNGSVAQAQNHAINAGAAKPGAYQSTWDSQLNAIMDQILNRKPFEYDMNSDALYQQYADMYRRQGALAMEDTMGQAAAMTGGYGNSYAQTAGQQVYQGYMDQLNDRVPELYQLALAKDQAEVDALKDSYALLASREEQDYGRYRDALGDYYTEEELAYQKYMDERNWQYQLGRDDVSDSRYDQEWQYQLERDELSDSRYEQEWEQSLKDSEEEKAYSLALSMLQSGMMPSDSVLAAAGIGAEDAQKIYNQAVSAMYSSGGGSGSGSGSSKGSSSNSSSGSGKALSDAQWSNLQTLYEQVMKSGDRSAYDRQIIALQERGYNVDSFKSYVNKVYAAGEDAKDSALPPTDENILSLGYGPISAKKLMELEDSGLIGRRIKNGRIEFYNIKKASAGNSPASKMGGYT